MSDWDNKTVPDILADIEAALRQTLSESPPDIVIPYRTYYRMYILPLKLLLDRSRKMKRRVRRRPK